MVAPATAAPLAAAPSEAPPADWWLSVPAESPFAQRGAVEQASIQRALDGLGLAPDVEPFGKQVCAVDVWREPVFRQEDLLPVWANLFHTTTRERLLRAVLPIRVGDRLDRDAWVQAERTVRDPVTMSVTALVTAADDTDGCVRLVVVARDTWSLRTIFAAETSGSVVSSLVVGATESNLFGTGDTLSLSLTRTLGAWSIGPLYYSPHFARTHVTVSNDLKFVLDREVGGLEGVVNSASVALPFYREGQRWSWSLAAAHDDSLRRRYTGAALDQWTVTSDGAAYQVDERYRVTASSARASATRQWGGVWRHRLSPGYAFSTSATAAVPRDAALPGDVVDAYEAARVPRGEQLSGPTLGYRLFENRYLRLVDYDTYAVTEELQLGVNSAVSVQHVEPALGGDARFVALSTEHVYRAALGDDAFVVGAVSASARASGAVTDVVPSATVRLVTPRVMYGRVILRGTFSAVERDTRNALLSIGSDSGLRGYPIGYLKGDRRLQLNGEWRSRPARVVQARLGGVVFVDVGGAWAAGDAAALAGSAGVGLRLMLPVLGTVVRVGDLAVPFAAPSRPVFSFGIGQRF